MSTMDELVRLAKLADAYEKEHDLPQRSFLYSTSPTGSESGRKYIFGAGVQLRGKDAALAHMRLIASEYGLS